MQFYDTDLQSEHPPSDIMSDKDLPKEKLRRQKLLFKEEFFRVQKEFREVIPHANPSAASTTKSLPTSTASSSSSSKSARTSTTTQTNASSSTARPSRSSTSSAPRRTLGWTRP